MPKNSLSRFICALSKAIRRKKESTFLHSLTSMRFNGKGIKKGVHYRNVSYCYENQDPKDLSIRKCTHTFGLELSSCTI